MHFQADGNAGLKLQCLTIFQLYREGQF